MLKKCALDGCKKLANRSPTEFCSEDCKRIHETIGIPTFDQCIEEITQRAQPEPGVFYEIRSKNRKPVKFPGNFWNAVLDYYNEYELASKLSKIGKRTPYIQFLEHWYHDTKEYIEAMMDGDSSLTEPYEYNGIDTFLEELKMSLEENQNTHITGRSESR